MKVIESQAWSAALYQRYEMSSSAHAGQQRFGLIRPNGLTTAEVCATLYFLHGGDGDDHQFVDAGLGAVLDAEITDFLLKHRAQIVLPAIGASFLLGAAGNHFRDELIPTIEAGTDPKHQRSIGGFSLGGSVALSEFFRNPARYAGVAVHYPAILDFDFHSEKEQARHALDTGTDLQWIKMACGLFQTAFPDLQAYRDFCPFKLVARANAAELAGKPLYIDVGANDSFGFHRSAGRLSQALSERDLPHQYHLIAEGKHDAEFIRARLGYLLKAVFGASP